MSSDRADRRGEGRLWGILCLQIRKDRMQPVHLAPDENNVVVSLIRRYLVPIVNAYLDEDWDGAENIPSEGGAVVAYNHVSTIDPFVAGHFILSGGRRYPHFLGKVEIFAVPLVGRLLIKAGQVPVYRGTDKARDSFSAAVKSVSEGKVVCILPEGTLTRDPNLWPMDGKSGAARIALSADVPLIPVAVWGPQDILRGHGFGWKALLKAAVKRHHVTVVAGPAVDLDDLREQPLTQATLQEATDRLMTAITMLLAQIRHEEPPTERMANPRVVSHTVKSPRKRRRGAKS